MTTTDDWKKHRYVVIKDAELTEYDGPMIIMTDVGFWADHVDECIAWCSQNNCELQGMTIKIPNQETLTLFALRWS